jgi:hypothetical protein
LAARTISALLRGSAITVVRKEVSAWPCAAAGPVAVPPPVDQPLHHGRQVGGQGVLQRDHFDVGGVGDVQRRDDAAMRCRLSA